MRRSRATLGLILHLSLQMVTESRLTVALLVAAIAAGMGFQVPNSANLDGYRDELLVQGLATGFGDVRLRPREGRRFVDADALAVRVASAAQARAVLPLLTLPGAVGHEGNFVGAAVTGLDQTQARRPFRLVAGELVSRGDREGIVLGAALAAQLGAKVGDSVQLRLVLGTASTLLDEDDIGRYTMVVRGLAAGAFGACGSETALVDRSFLARELGEERAADLILVYSDAPFAATELASRLGASFPEVLSRPWTEDSKFLGNAVQASSAVASVTRSMVVFAVLIPVWALLHIHVLHRQRQIGILRALGFRQIEIFAAYLSQALLVGVVGVALGALIGYGLLSWFQAHPIFEMDDFVLRPAISAGSFLWPACLVLATTLAAGVVPAWRAARLDPARALREID